MGMQRALDFVLFNQGLIDKTLLFNLKLIRIDKSVPHHPSALCCLTHLTLTHLKLMQIHKSAPATSSLHCAPSPTLFTVLREGERREGQWLWALVVRRQVRM